MKIVYFVFMAILFATSTNAATTVIGINPSVTKTSAEQQWQALTTVLDKVSQPGANIDIYDTANLTLLLSVAIPNDSRYRSSKARNKLMVRSMGPLIKRFKTPQVTAAANDALFLNRLSLLYTHHNQQAIDVILLSNRPYANISQGIDFSRGYPTYALTENQSSDFWVKPEISRAPMRLHYFYLDKQRHINERHRRNIESFYAGYIQKLGGGLFTFSHDISDIRFIESAQEIRPSPESNQSDTKVAFYLVHNENLDWLIQTAKFTETPLAAAPQRFKLGIQWDCGACDLDLYVQSHAGARFLNFAHTLDSTGYYLKDYHTNPQVPFGYESVIFTEAVGLEQLNVWVNYYSGNAYQPKGELRLLSPNGELRRVPFQLLASQGNSGGDFSNAARSPYWVKIDVTKLVAR